MINSIIMRGIKGANTEQPLTGRDIITGHNGAGKTTRVQALGISLLGYAPGNGKVAAETFKLASENPMTVGLKTDEFEFTRTFSKKDKTVSQSISLMPPNGEKTAAAKEKRIASELGNIPVMLDFGEFIGLSDTKRREFIYALAADGEAQDIDEIKELVRKHIKLPETADPKQAEILETDIDECAAAYTTADSVQDGLQAMSDYAKEQLTFWKKEREKAVGTAQKMSEYKNTLAETDRNLEANRAKLAEYQNELQTIAGQLAAAEEKERESERKKERIAELQAEIEAISGAEKPNDPAEIKALIEQYKSDIREIDNGSLIKVKQAELKTLRDEQTQLTQKQNESRERFYEIKSKRDANLAILEKLKSSSNGVCAIDCRIKCDKDFSEYIEHLNVEISEQEKTMNEGIKAGKAIKDKFDENTVRIAELETGIEYLQNEEIEARKENSDIQAIIAELTADLSAAENFETDRAARIATMQSELNALAGTRESPTNAPDEVGGIISRRDELKGIVDDLSAKINEQMKARDALAAMKNSMADGTEAGYQTDAWKAIAEAVGVKGLQGKLVKDTLLPLTQDVQYKLDKMGITKTFRFVTTDEKEKEIFQFGWKTENGDFRNFDALSTGEQMLLLIALMTTIIERLNPPLKALVIDNSENLDRENLKRVLNGLTIAGESFDNIIFCGVFTLEQSEMPNWKIWDLGADND